jgi:ubiquinone biosynthesis protein UbiJ
MPEEPRPIIRGAEPTSLVLQAMDEIDALKKAVAGLVKRLEALEHRVASMEKPTA